VTQAIQPRISVSLVLYQADLEMVMQVVHRLVDAYCYAGFFSGLHIYLIDNGGSSSVLSYFQREYISWKSFMTFDWISGHGNIGYGAAHNLAIRRADSDFHLILNPDVLIDKATFVEACRFFNNHPEAGLIAHMSQMETEKCNIYANDIPRSGFYFFEDLHQNGFSGGVKNVLKLTL